MLEALLKRVDGLEKRLQDEKNPISPTSPDKILDEPPPNQPNGRRNTIDISMFNSFSSGKSRPAVSTPLSQPAEPIARPIAHGPLLSLPAQSQTQNGVLSEMVLDTYFARLHGKPFFILDETTTRQRHQMNQLPPHLSMAISAMTLR